MSLPTLDSPEASQPLQVLACDDVPDNLEILRQLLESLGHVMLPATTGEQAVELFRIRQPDLVLMDVMLPGIDGCQAVQQIRALAGERWVPIIFLSALDKPRDMIRGLDAGGDDYMVKPIDLRLLMAKLGAMQRIVAMQARLKATTLELQAYREQADHELEIARNLLEHMTAADALDTPGLSVWIVPAAGFSGDLLLARRARNGDLFLMHADSMGHGLPAALPLLPIAPIFTSMVERGHGVASIVREMNGRLRHQLPSGRFVSATVARIDSRNRLVEIWNGGNPAALLLDAKGEPLARFEANHPPLGLMGDEEFCSDVRAWQCQQPVRLLVYSDGLEEAMSPSGESFGLTAILATMDQTAAPGAGLAPLQAALGRHLAGRDAHDDVSVILFDY